MCIGNANGMQQYIWSFFLSRAFVARFLFRFLDSYTTERRLYIPVQNCILVSTTANKIKQTRSKVIWQLLMQSYISHLPGTVFNALIIFLSLSCSIDLFLKTLGNCRKYDIFFNFCFTENMIFASFAENKENMIFTNIC